MELQCLPFPGMRMLVMVCTYLIPGIFNCLSRIVHGFLGDVQWLRDNRIILCIYAYAMVGINKIFSFKATSYVYLAVFAAVDGFANGE